MTTSTPERPSAQHERPQETPAELARAVAQLATAPVRDFIACISDEDNERDQLYQRLVARLTAAHPSAWSKAREDVVDEQLRVSLSNNKDRELFNRHLDDCSTKRSIGQEAAFLLGVEVGRLITTAVEDVAGVPGGAA